MTFVDWLRNVAAVGTFLALVALGLVKWFAPKWIDHRFGVRLEEFKAAQQTKLEEFKSDQQKELERLRHRLSSRISKIHEKEFEVLPKAWFMLNELHGSVVLALDLTLKFYPDFRQLPDAQFEEFLTSTRLTDYQKQGLRNSPDRNKYFSQAMAGTYLDDANEKQRVFRNYLIEHRIFMTEELRNQFGTAIDSLTTALTQYDVGKDAKNWEMERSGQREVSRLKAMIDDVEQAVQRRLHYEEA